MCHVLRTLQIHVAVVQETWLDASTENLDVPGYVVIGRRDRSESENRGGILTLVRLDVKNVVLLFKAENAERAFHLIQRDSGSILLVNWYRPPSSDLSSIDSLPLEVQQAASSSDEIIICGDLNVHQRRWLRFSSGNTSEGERLRHVTEELGLWQLVQQPTRNEYLLDLVLTNLDVVKVRLGPKLSDHFSLLVKVADAVEMRELPSRKIWQFSKADWSQVKASINMQD